MTGWWWWCSGPGSAARQAESLREEGVEVDTDAMGEFYVDFARYGWFPDPEVFDDDDDDHDDEEV